MTDAVGQPAPQPDPTSVADRAAGMVMASAWGDALGARYEGLHWAPGPARVRFGRGILAWRRPGWWTDDTDMSLGLLLAMRDLAAGGRVPPTVDDDEGRLAVLRAWVDWHRGSNPLDAGLNTWRVLHRVARISPLDLPAALAVSRAQLARSRRGGGNGAVMRTAPVALPYLGRPRQAWSAAYGIAELTHPQDRAGEAAGLWTVLCERAVSTGSLDPSAALELTSPRPAEAGTGDPFWVDLLGSADRPGRNGARGWAPTTVADAWWCVRAAVAECGTAPAAVERGLRLAVSSGQDPDTTAAVAGALLGAVVGRCAVPSEVRTVVHGGRWTGRTWRLDDLGDLAAGIVGDGTIANCSQLPP